MRNLLPLLLTKLIFQSKLTVSTRLIPILAQVTCGFSDRLVMYCSLSILDDRLLLLGLSGRSKLCVAGQNQCTTSATTLVLIVIIVSKAATRVCLALHQTTYICVRF